MGNSEFQNHTFHKSTINFLQKIIINRNQHISIAVKLDLCVRAKINASGDTGKSESNHLTLPETSTT